MTGQKMRYHVLNLGVPITVFLLRGTGDWWGFLLGVASGLALAELVDDLAAGRR